MDYTNTGKQILAAVGGAENVNQLVHCMTRLRFNLKDPSLPNVEELKNIKGVVGTVNKGGQFQVIIGGEVSSVYQAIMNLNVIKQNESNKDDNPQKEEKKGLDAVFDTISGIFAPVLAPLIAVGLVKSILAILVITGAMTNQSTTYTILNAVGDSLFYFFPVLLGYTASVKFKCNPFMGAVMGAIMIHPNMIALMKSGEAISLFGLPVRPVTYASSVLPIILTVWAMSYIEKFADKVSPKVIKSFLKPLIIVAITTPLMLVVLGPIGGIIGDGLAALMKGIEGIAPWLIPTIIGALSPLLVMTGMHYSLLPININNRVTLGYDTFLSPGMMVSNIAQGAAGFAVALRTKDKELKQMSFSSAITAVLGITEPVLYGCNLKLKKPLYAVIAGGGMGGLYIGLTSVKSYAASGSPGLLALPGYIHQVDTANIIHACIGAVIAFVSTFIITLILGFDDGTKKAKVKEVEKQPLKEAVQKESEIITTPITGVVKKLSEVNDPTFAQGLMGQGVAIEPTVGRVVSPVDGMVATIFNTKHAIALVSDSGAEVLIHVGMDTVELGGKHFKAHIETGQRVKKGELLVEFDIEAIKAAGYELTTPVIITNSQNYTTINVLEEHESTETKDLIELAI